MSKAKKRKEFVPDPWTYVYWRFAKVDRERLDELAKDHAWARMVRMFVFEIGGSMHFYAGDLPKDRDGRPSDDAIREALRKRIHHVMCDDCKTVPYEILGGVGTQGDPILVRLDLQAVVEDRHG